VLTFQDDSGSIFRIVPTDVDADDTGDEADEAGGVEETADDRGAPSLAQVLAERVTRNNLNQ
jgi:hypothetical protein